MNYFFDAHFHAMTLSHPNFLSFFDSLDEGGIGELVSGGLSPAYILTPANLKKLQFIHSVMNTLTVFERPIGEIFAMMEDDLMGKFQRPDETSRATDIVYPEKPYIRDGIFHFRNTPYEKLGMCPLVMDFSRDKQEWKKLYYSADQQEKILTYLEDTLEGIHWYHKERPEGLFEFFPFLGINPVMHELPFIENLLNTYVTTEHRILTPKQKGKKKYQKKRFYGIKFYPPLGTNPWPEESHEREKFEFIYDFCESNRIPITTHCDDQGFRGVPSKIAWQNTAPKSWKPALQAYPNLMVNFAHFGRQYSFSGKKAFQRISHLGKSFPDSEWFYDILDLMREFPHVYTDVSFSGGSHAFYQSLFDYITEAGDTIAPHLLERIMFGSDFSVNLLKVESYTNYYRIFETSPFEDQHIRTFSSINPTRFLGL